MISVSAANALVLFVSFQLAETAAETQPVAVENQGGREWRAEEKRRRKRREPVAGDGIGVSE